MLARSFFIKSSSKLLVTRTGTKARTSLILGWIRLLTLELLALEWWKFHIFELEYLWSQLANLDQILYVALLGVGKGCIMFWGRLDQNSGVHGNRKPPLIHNGENGVSTFSRLLSIRSILNLQVTRACIKSRTSLNFGQVGPLTTEVAALERLNISHRLIMGKWCLHASSFIFYRIIIKVAGNQDSIKTWSSSILGRIRPLILELLALECRKFHTFQLEYLWSQMANLDQILCVASLGWGERLHNVLTLAPWTQVSDRCPLGYLFIHCLEMNYLASTRKNPKISDTRKFAVITLKV